MPAEHWHEWRRLEAVVNLALAHHNAWAVCVYDRHALTDERVDDLCATHPLVWSSRQHRPNDRYQDPTRFIAEHRDAPPDPVEQTAPAVELIDPSPAAARATVNGLTKHSGLLAAEAEGMILATSEAVANAHPARPAARRAAPLGATGPDDRHRDRHRHRTDRPLRRPPTAGTDPNGRPGSACGSATSWSTSPTAATPAATPSA